MSATLDRTVQIGLQNLDEARRVLRAIQQVGNQEQLPHLVLVDPAELALEPGMYELIFKALRWINSLLYCRPEVSGAVTHQVPTAEWAHGQGNLDDLLAASLPDDFKWWFTKIEPLFEPAEADQ